MCISRHLIVLSVLIHIGFARDLQWIFIKNWNPCGYFSSAKISNITSRRTKAERICQTNFCLFMSSSKSASHAAATGSSDGAAAPQTSSLRSKGLGLLNKVKMSVELLIALAALLSWLVVGVVMFDFVEYKAVPGKPQNLKMYVPKSFKPSVMQNLTNMFAIIVRHPADHNGPCPGRERRHWWVIQSAQ